MNTLLTILGVYLIIGIIMDAWGTWDAYNSGSRCFVIVEAAVLGVAVGPLMLVVAIMLVIGCELADWAAPEARGPIVTEGQMSKPWVENEQGPSCRCGEGSTVVKLNSTGHAILWCLLHHDGEGASWELPPEKPAGLPDDPEQWPEFLWPEQSRSDR